MASPHSVPSPASTVIPFPLHRTRPPTPARHLRNAPNAPIVRLPAPSPLPAAAPFTPAKPAAPMTEPAARALAESFLALRAWPDEMLLLAPDLLQAMGRGFREG